MYTLTPRTPKPQVSKRAEPLKGPESGHDHHQWVRTLNPTPAPAPHLAHPEGYAALRFVLVTVLRVSRSCVHLQDEFDLHLLQWLHTILANKL